MDFLNDIEMEYLHDKDLSYFIDVKDYPSQEKVRVSSTIQEARISLQDLLIPVAFYKEDGINKV